MTQWALVTGAARRIGREISLTLAREGWNIIIHYHASQKEALTLAEEIQKLGNSACLAEIDLADSKSVANLIPSLVEEVGVIGALVNNAALFEPDTMDQDGLRHWAVNAEAPRLLSKAFYKHLDKKERGVIVNLLDEAVQKKETMLPNFSSYTRSKIFLTEMTLNMAKSFAPQLRVNGVAPLYVLKSARQSDDAFRKLAGDKITLTKQVAEAVVRLVETPTITGQILKLN